MKFYSKSLNYQAVLRPGIPGDRFAGRAPVAGLYIRFEDGVADVKNEEHIKLLMEHDGFGSDFIAGEEDSKDPFYRNPSEPEHSIIEMKYGHPEKQLNPQKPRLTKDQHMVAMEAAKGMAAEIAKELAPVIAKDMVKQALEEMGVGADSKPAKKTAKKVAKKATKKETAAEEAAE